MARKFKSSKISGKKILLIDDDQEYIDATKKLLENEGHIVSFTKNGIDALELLKTDYFDLILVDYYMPKMTGEELVTKLREFNPYVQVILQTGYASEQPSRELIHKLDIQGYYDKSEGPEKLLMWVDIGLKAAYTIQLLYKSREGLNYILNVTPDLHMIQPLGDLLQGILLQISGLLGISNSFVAVLPYRSPKDASNPKDSPNLAEGFIAVMDDNSELIIHAGTGKFVSQLSVDKYLSKEEIELIYTSLQSKEIKVIISKTIVPLLVGNNKIGIIYIDQVIEKEQDLYLLKIFANQAAVAIHNIRLYQMATYDPLTNVFLRGVFIKALIREIRIAYRSGSPVSLLILDIDGMKTINDTIGHLAGDRALEIMGSALFDATRQTDIKGRIGGDEFAVVLPNSSLENAKKVGERILFFLTNKGIPDGKSVIPVKCSIGVGILESKSLSTIKTTLPVANQYFQFMTKMVIKKADELLYQAKKMGGNQMNLKDSIIEWSPYEKAMEEFDNEAE